MNVAERILARGEPEAKAVVWCGGALTYDQLRHEVGRFATTLLSRGCINSDRVGIWSENSPFFIASYLGTIYAGLVAVPFQTEMDEATFGRITRDAGIRKVFVSKRSLTRVRPWAERLGVELVDEGKLQVPEVGGNHGWTRMDTQPGNAECGIHSPQSTVHSPQSAVHGSETEVQSPKSKVQSREAEVQSPKSEVSSLKPQASSFRSQVSSPKSQVQNPEVNGQKGAADELAALMFTSGTTGAPKGVMVSHLNIECNTRDIVSYIGLGPDDRGLVVLPFHYCYGISLLHTLLMAGGTVVINNDFRLYPEAALQDVEQHECTGLAGVPSTYQILSRKSRFLRTTLPKLRWLQQAGGKLPNPFITEIVDCFPHIRFFLMYGQTEATARLSYLAPERLSDKLGSIGTGLPSTRLEVLRADGARAIPGSDETGEIVATGDNIASGYWNDPSESFHYFRNGRLYTGDIAQADKDGFLFIVAREREMIKVGGNRVSAKEVEDVIARLPQVVEVAAVGRLHDLLGECIRSFVVTRSKGELSEEAVKAHCRKQLPAFKVPDEVIFLEEMPHNSSGKILKARLREEWRE